MSKAKGQKRKRKRRKSNERVAINIFSWDRRKRSKALHIAERNPLAWPHFPFPTKMRTFTILISVSIFLSKPPFHYLINNNNNNNKKKKTTPQLLSIEI
jgi:hypothetical protein